MHLRVLTAAAACSLAFTGCGDLNDPTGDNTGDPTGLTDPLEPPDDTNEPTDDPDPVDYLDISAGYFVASFGYDAKTESITSAWIDGTELVPQMTLVMYEDGWTFDYTDPRWCMVQFTMEDAVEAPWLSSDPGLVFGVVDNTSSPGFTDCYDDSFRPAVDPALWPDLVDFLGSDLGFGIGARSERVDELFQEDAEYLDSLGLVGGVMAIPDTFTHSPMYRDAYTYSYAVDEDFELVIEHNEPEYIPAADVLATPGQVPSGYYELASLDTWVFEVE